MTLDEATDEEYNERFSEEDKLFLDKKSIPPHQANEYHSRFSAQEISVFINHGKDAGEVNDYNAHFSVKDVLEFMRANVSSKEANLFEERFTGREVICLMRSDVSSELASQYDLRFSGFDIESLVTVGVSPIETHSYKSTYNGEDIRRLHVLGIKYRKMSEEEERKVLEGYSRLYDEEFNGYCAFTIIEDFSPLNYESSGGGFCYFTLRGTGASGGVLSWNGLAWKFSLEIDKEYKLLLRNHKFHKGEQKNTIKVKGPIRHDIVAMIEFVPGRTLAEIISSGQLSNHQKIFQYSSGVFQGLLELYEAGIYHHRDLRPANIMIDEENDRAVIIDLGIATTDRDALAKDNRRFGSPTGRAANDLNSLGQIMYKMATGEHIFTESKSMERTTYADQVRDHRDWIYEDPERLVPYLETVERRVEDHTLRDIITFCLKSEGKDEEYQELEKRFTHVTSYPAT